MTEWKFPTYYIFYKDFVIHVQGKEGRMFTIKTKHQHSVKFPRFVPGDCLDFCNVELSK